jgi:hypothetical protein
VISTVDHPYGSPSRHHNFITKCLAVSPLMQRLCCADTPGPWHTSLIIPDAHPLCGIPSACATYHRQPIRWIRPSTTLYEWAGPGQGLCRDCACRECAGIGSHFGEVQSRLPGAVRRVQFEAFQGNFGAFRQSGISPSVSLQSISVRSALLT